MKKYLGILLALALVLSSAFVGVDFTDAFANTPSDMLSVTAAVEKQGGLNGGAVLDAVQYVSKGDEVTVSAVPYYGNGFIGWFNGNEKVSSELKYTFLPDGDITLSAKFDIRNLIENGDAEVVADQSVLIDSINNAAVKYDNTYDGTASVVTTDGVANSAVGYGDYALKLTPSASNHAAKVKDLANFPLTVKKNTDYILRFSYKYDDNAAGFDMSRKHYIHLALNGPDAQGKIQFNDTDHTIKWTFHSHPSGTEFKDTDSSFKNIYSWGGANGYISDSSSLIGKFVTDNGTLRDDVWQDVYLLFNPGEDADVFGNGGETGTIYVSLGTPAATTDFLLLDNLSLSEAESNSLSQVTATSGGSVSVDTKRSGENYYVYTSGPRGASTSFTGRDTNNIYYPSIYEQFTASAYEGSSFIGWFDENGNCVSTERVAYLLMNGKKYTAKFAKGLSAEGGGYIENNGDGTYTAHAYYGNRFLGWFDGTVSPYVHKTDDLTITKEGHLGYVAMFTSENLLADGDFETNSDTANIYAAYTDYDSLFSGNYSIVPTCVPGSGPEFGEYCLQIVPSANEHAAKRKGMLNIPVELTAGKKYLWKFSYAILTANYDASKDYLTFAVDTADSNGKIPWDPGVSNLVPLSYHAELSTATEVNKSDWAWGNQDGTPYAYRDNKNISGGNVWVDIYVLIEPNKTEKHYLSLGCFENQHNPYLFDNMSLTEVKDNPQGIASVTSAENGKVYSYRADEAAYRVTAPKGSANLYATSVLLDNPIYPDMYVDYFARADVGFVFDGWYNTSDGSLYSDAEQIRIKLLSDEKIEARFKADDKKYSARAEVEKQNGRFGGYISGESEYASVTSGEQVSFTAVAYRGSRFLGWYNGATLVSDKQTVSISVTADTVLTAKFENFNLFTDGGYENTAPATTVLGEGKEWNSADSTAGAVVAGNEAFDGKQSVAFTAGSALSQSFSLEAGKDYYLSFRYKFASKEGAALEYVKFYNAASQTVASFDTATAATGDWQKFDLNVSAGDNTALTLELKFAGNGAVYLDDLVLYDLSKLPLDITARVEKQDGIFGGYIVGDKEFSVNYLENVTVKAVAYEKNTFLGWYDGDKLVSTDAEYTFAAKFFSNLLAKFEIRNLWPDSGYENTAPDVSLSENGDWTVSEKHHEMYNFDVTVTGSGSFSGTQMLSALHRNTMFSTVISGLEANEDYFLSFRVRTRKTLDNCFFQSAKIIGEATGDTLGTGFGTANGGQWELISVPFATGNDTSVKIEFIYSAGEQECYFDDFALYQSHNVGVYANDGGSVQSTLNGGENGPAASGTEITVTATPDAGNTFLGWYDYMNPTVLLSTANPYTFTVNKTQHVVAKFAGDNVEPENMLIDGDFENGCFQGFKFAGYNNGDVSFCTYQVTKKVGNITPVSGDYMVKVAANARNSNLLVKNLKPHTDYTVSFYWLGNEYIEFNMVGAFKYMAELEGFVSQEDGGATKQQNKHYHANGTMLRADGENYAYINGKGDGKTWRKVEFSFNSDNRDAAIILINYGRTGGNDGIYFDNIRVYEDGHYTDGVENGDFEKNNTVGGWQGDARIANDGQNKFGVSDSVIYNGVNMETVKGYKLSFKAKSSEGAKLLYGMAQSGNTALANGERIESMTNASYGTAALTNEWKEYTLYFQSIGYRSGNIVFESANGAEFMVDDVVFERADRLVPVNRLTFENTEEKDFINSTYESIIGHPELDQKNSEWYEFSSVSHSGNGSLLMKYKSEYASHALTQPWSGLSLESGRSYRVSFWAKAERAGSKFISGVARTDQKFNHTFLSEKTFELKNTEWTQFCYTFTTDNLWYAANTVANFVVNGIENETTCDIYFDDIEITEWSTSVIGASDMLYTEDVSQNYFGNYSFEKTGDIFDRYAKTGDASLGGRYITLKAGDRIILPVSTRTDYNLAYECVYTFAADIRGKGARGIVSLSYSADGEELIRDKNGNEVTLSVDTNGEWKRSGFNFDGNRNETEYLVLECTEGSFDVDYIALFNSAHGFKECTIDTSVSPSKSEIGYVDMSSSTALNYITGKIEGLPEGSAVMLRGGTDYYGELDIDGNYSISDIQNGEYKMYIAPAGKAMTLWGEVVFEGGKIAGLGKTRLNGYAVSIAGTGAKNGIVKIADKDTGYSYLVSTDENGAFEAYILECAWELVGTTNDATALMDGGIVLGDFAFDGADKQSAPTVNTVPLDGTPLAAILTVMLSALALIVLTFKKGECK